MKFSVLKFHISQSCVMFTFSLGARVFCFQSWPQTDSSLFRSWWSLTNIMQVIASSLVQPVSREMTQPLCIVQFLKIECSMLIIPLSRWFIANLRPLVTSFRVNMWLQFDNKPSDIQIICNFKLYLYPDLSPSIIFDNVYVHSIT